MFCQNCGTQLNPGQKYCPKCGAPTREFQSQNPQGSQGPQPSQAPQPSPPPQGTMPGQGMNPYENQDTGSGVMIALIIVVSILLLLILLVGAYFLFLAPTAGTSTESESQTADSSGRDVSDDVSSEDPTTLATGAETAKEYAEDSDLDLEKDKKDGKTIYTGYDGAIEVGTTDNGDGYYVFQGKANDALSFCGVQVGMTKGDAKAALKDNGYSCEDKDGKLKCKIDNTRKLSAYYEDGTITKLDYVSIPKTEQRPADEKSASSGSSSSSTDSSPRKSGGNYDDEILPQSDDYYLTESDIAHLDRDGIKLAKNEIYARWGAHFHTDWIRDHFNSTSWYIDEGRDAESCVPYMNKFEKANIDFLKSRE